MAKGAKSSQWTVLSGASLSLAYQAFEVRPLPSVSFLLGLVFQPRDRSPCSHPNGPQLASSKVNAKTGHKTAGAFQVHGG